MEFPTRSSPYLPLPNNLTRLMVAAKLALIPGALALFWFFGWGIVFNLLIATTTALLAEAGVLWLRNRPIRPALLDGSAALTGLLLGLALPPLAPWWIPVIGALFAIVIAKQLYGGIGYNPFNHHFYECNQVKNLWRNIQRDINEISNNVIHLIVTGETVMLGLVEKDEHLSMDIYKMINHIILIGKYSIVKYRLRDNANLQYLYVMERNLRIPLFDMRDVNR